MSIGLLLKSNKTVFNLKDLALVWNELEMSKVQDKARYYAKQKKLIRVKQGIYSTSNNYDKFELASKLLSPSYISLETVLKQEAMIFQSYESIFSVSIKNKDFEIGEQFYYFKQMKKSIATNLRGLESKENYWIAKKERAFLDAIYLYKDYHFDNLLGLDWDYVFELIHIYDNKAMLERVRKYYRDYA